MFGLVLVIGMALCGCSSGNVSSGGGGTGGGTGAAVLAKLGTLGVTPSGGSWVVAGEGGFTLLAGGTGFTSTSVVQWNGTALTTQFGTSTDINAPVTAAMIAQPGTASITVHDTAAGTTTSALSFGIASLPQPP
jgi:hypothetical protein